MKRILLVSIALCLGLSSMAEAGGIGVAVRGSTLGGGLEVGLGLAPDLSLRGGLNGATYSYSGTESGNDYEFDLTLSSVTGLVDYHLLGGGFRITGGLVLNGNKLEAVAETGFNVEYDVGGVIYTVEEVGTLNGDIEFSSTAPYAGIGWGNIVGEDKKLGLLLDIGVVLQGSPSVSLSTTKELPEPELQAELEANLQREEEALEEDLKAFDFYPVVSIGISYKF